MRRIWGGGGREHMVFQEELRGNQSTPTYYKGRGLKKIACQSTDNERGIIRILQRLRRDHNQIHPTSSPSPPFADQSTPTYYKGRGLEKIACQSTDNERGIIRILQRLRRDHNQIHPTSSPSPRPSPINNDQSINGLCVTYQLLQLHSIAGCRSLQLQESVQICTQ